MTANETPGIDEAWSKADPAATYAAGYRYVLGYSSRDLSKTMTRPWREAYRAAGLAVGLVFEDGADRALGGAAAGAADGALADGQATAAGYDPGAVIFFAVDFDATADQIAGPIAAYAAAFDAATGRPVGVYGSCAVVDGLVTPGQRPVRFGWQTAAWSGGQLSDKANIYQRVGHNWPLLPGIAANGFDEDVITAAVPLDGGVLTPPGQAAPEDPAPAPAASADHPPVFGWYLPAGHYYGNLTGPAVCHGGATPDEQWHVRNIQQWLIYQCCVPGVDRSQWATSGWADGRWEAATDTAMAVWHQGHYPGQPNQTQCWADDYNRLATA